jgi:hypothetical protein
MHQVDMDLEWPMIDIPQELREMNVDQDDLNTRSNSQANAIRVSVHALPDFRQGLFLRRGHVYRPRIAVPSCPLVPRCSRCATIVFVFLESF